MPRKKTQALKRVQQPKEELGQEILSHSEHELAKKRVESAMVLA